MKKGFTIVETLAIIVMLGIMAVIVIPNIAGIYDNQKLSKEEKAIQMIEAAAETYDINQNDSQSEMIISLTTLIDENLIEVAIFKDTNIDFADPKQGVYKHLVSGKTTYEYMADTSGIIIP